MSELNAREELALEEWVEAYRATCPEKLIRKGGEYVGPCPNCGGDDRFAMASRGTGTKINCRKCGDFKAIVAILWGMSPEKPGGLERYAPHAEESKPKEEKPDGQVYGCTLDQFKEKIGVPISEAYKITESTWSIEGHGRVPSVRIPYLDDDDQEISAKHRVQVHGTDKYRYEPGCKSAVYGVQWLLQARNRSKLLIVEGESDALTLWFHGFPAIGIPGSKACRVIEKEHLDGIGEIFVVSERDTAGEIFPRTVAIRVAEVGSRAVVRRVRLPAADTNALYHESPQAFERIVKRACLDARGIRESKIWGATTGTILATTYPPQKWIVPGIVPVGVTVLFASPKTGKSFLALQIAVGVTRGERIAGCWRPEDRADVLLIDLEQIVGANMQDRLRHHGLAFKDHGMRITDEAPRIGEGFLEEISAYLDEQPGCRLVIVDVWTLIKPSSERGGNAYDSEYKAMQALDRLFEKKAAACLLVHHDKKGTEEGITDKMSGSKALSGASSSLLWLVRTVGEENGHLMVSGNHAQEGPLECSFVDRKWVVEPRQESNW